MFRNTKAKIRFILNKKNESYLAFYNIFKIYPINISLYQEAITHKSFIESNSKNNERLEFLGDAILNAAVTDILYKKFNNKKEGFLTDLRSRIVKRESLNRISKELGINNILRISTKNISENSNIYGDALEAIIGAMYLDRGYRITKKFIYETLIKQHINIEKVIKEEVDFKSRLIEWGQKHKIDIVFKITDAFFDEKNNHIFKSQAIASSIIIGEGYGHSKKESHQKAAKIAIFKIRQDENLSKEIIDNINTNNSI